jgi:hypothetical protein
MRTALFTTALTLLAMTAPSFAQDTRQQRHDRLDFMVGEWTTSHEIPGPEGEPIVYDGAASIQWTVGDAWLRHELHFVVPERGDVYSTGMINFSPSVDKYNFYMFDQFGGEAGAFYGDFIDDTTIVFKAKFEEDDGSFTHQRITITSLSDDEIGLSVAFSDDGEHYHFEVKGVYTRSPV